VKPRSRIEVGSKSTKSARHSVQKSSLCRLHTNDRLPPDDMILISLNACSIIDLPSSDVVAVSHVVRVSNMC
jgi:hypothetical protein